MTDQHPITPPPELVRQWGIASPCKCDNTHWAYEQFIAAEAAQWGANQELQHCAGWVDQFTHSRSTDLIDARRPKPPSLKQQALEIIDDSIDDGPGRVVYALEEIKIVRRALEALPDD